MAKDKEGGKKQKKAKLPPNLEQQRAYVECGPDKNKHTNTMTSAHMFRPLGIDNSWDLDEFKENFEIKINRLTPHDMEFDLIGCEPAIANALRRILIAEVPTIAAEHVFVVNNTSIIQDEVLAHRLGLVPLRVDPTLFDYKSTEEAASEKNTLVFKMDITCRRDKDMVVNDKVLSKHLVWEPQGSRMPDETSCRFAQGQAHMFDEDSKPQPVHDDILLAKLRPGQTIQLEAHCIKGCGKEHAKWSPVATAWYRLLPVVELKREVAVTEQIAQDLMAAAPGLFVVEEGRLAVKEARGFEQHLEKVRHLLDRAEVASAVQYLKRKDHFIFTIESTGVLPPETLFEQALDLLLGKASKLEGRL